MPRTPDTLARHELNGLAVAVEAAANPDLVGITGRVTAETTKTLRVTDAAGTTRQVPKRQTTFRFTLPDGTAVDVLGDRLIAPPARRTETRGESAWV